MRLGTFFLLLVLPALVFVVHPGIAVAQTSVDEDNSPIDAEVEGDAFGVAAAGVIDFNSDGTGAIPNGFTSDDSPIVHFSDSIGANLSLGDFGAQSAFSNSIAVFDDFDASALVIDFDTKMQSVSLDFGNDDPGFSAPGDVAELRLFDGINPVGTVQVIMNRDDVHESDHHFYWSPCFDQA